MENMQKEKKLFINTNSFDITLQVVCSQFPL